jgi:integrase/recombinase XerD
MREYRSSLAPYITGLIKQKRACGYSYELEAYILESFDRFCVEQSHIAATITRDMVMKWAVQRPTEGKNYRNQRVSFVRQLALYMRSLGQHPYIPSHFASETVEVPHILSQAELRSFFAAVDAYMPPQPSLRRLVLTYRVLFRLFYCCGLRLAEGCYLPRSCVDLSNGTIKVLHAKGDKDRLVYLAHDVCVMCGQYDQAMQRIIPDRQWYFPGWYPDRAIRKTSVDKKFREFWNKTPNARKVDKKPTVQSLRHTFVVHKMNEWMSNGVDTAVMMPYLSRYLGHASIAETQYYFHTIEQAFPIVHRCDASSRHIIPEVMPYEA